MEEIGHQYCRWRREGGEERGREGEKERVGEKEGERKKLKRIMNRDRVCGVRVDQYGGIPGQM